MVGVRCQFCFAEGETPRPTREHLLSQPVASAFGIDRTATFGRTGDRLGDAVAIAPLNKVSVRSVCARCNNGWMNALEHRMAGLAVWATRTSSPLTVEHYESLRAWLLKTYLILTFIEGEVRGASRGADLTFIPNFTRARQLYEGDERAFVGLTLGLAAGPGDDRFAYVFGNPTVRPVGQHQGLNRVARGSVRT
jgi:hypothetical protein